MSLKAHASWSAGAAVILTGSRFALSAVLARRLAADGFGKFAYAQWLVEFCFLLLALGATGAVSRYAAEFRHDPTRLVGFMRAWRPFARGLPLGAAAAAMSGAMLAQLGLSDRALVALGIWTFASALWAMQTAALTGLQRFDLIFKANVLAATVMIAGASFLPFERGDPTRAFYVMAVACACAFLVGFKPVSASARGEASLLLSAERRRIVGYAINIWLTAILWNLAWARGEVPVVRAYLGDEGLARYAVALTLLGGAMAGVMLGIGGVAPQVTRYLGEGRKDLALQLCRKIGDLQLLTCGTAALALIWLGPELLRLAFGEEYRWSAHVLSILALGLPTLALSMNNHFLQITTDSRFNRNATLVGLAVLYVLALWLVRTRGVEGAALARVAALWIMALAAIVVSIAKLKGGGVGLFNIVLVFFISMLSSVLVSVIEDVALIWRVLALLLCMLGLIFGLRAADGGLVVNDAFKKLCA
jgi:O-antigen/teichoic acid export membrane protein